MARMLVRLGAWDGGSVERYGWEVSICESRGVDSGASVEM